MIDWLIVAFGAIGFGVLVGLPSIVRYRNEKAA